MEDSRKLMRFTKMQGTGNDYIYIDARFLDADWPSLSKAMADRHFGVGSDGIILILPSDSADLKMRMFNADGSEGEMCGNGIRCFAKYAIEQEICGKSNVAITVETLGGIRTVVPRMLNNNVIGAQVAMGLPRLRPEEVPANVDITLGERIRNAIVNYPIEVGHVPLKLSFISMGNPHAVAFIDSPVEQFPLHEIGPQIEHNPMFPKRMNFEIVNVIGQGHLQARVWERGSGETLACGSGASAIAVVAYLLGIAEHEVDISLPGGTLKVTWDGVGEVYLEGDAVKVFDGEWRY